MKNKQQQIFTTNLNRYLQQVDKTQREIAAKIGVSPQTFNTWCQGIAIPRMGKIQALADYFGINKSDLIEEHTDSNWQPAISPKDEKDIKKKLDDLLNQLTNETGLMYDGEPMDEESLDAVRAALEVAERTAMLEARRKFTPNKYKK